MKLTTAMLADAARVETGKLYIHGGGWNAIHVQTLPTKHPTLAFVMVLRVEYDEALQDLPVTVELIDEDDQPVGPAWEFFVNVGHPPRSQRGAAAFLPQTFTLNLFEFRRAGGYRFRVRSRDELLGDAPFSVVQAPLPAP
jgi:hypothetical protein